jgi:hypothetical protein
MPRTGSTTTGLFYDPDGHETRYISEQDGDSDAALNTGREAGVFPGKGRPNVVDHVEVKAAAAMRAGNVASGVLVVNYPGPPCGEQEWDAFLAHFELRKVALGTCGRDQGTPCAHETPASLNYGDNAAPGLWHAGAVGFIACR